MQDNRPDGAIALGISAIREIFAVNTPLAEMKRIRAAREK